MACNDYNGTTANSTNEQDNLTAVLYGIRDLRLVSILPKFIFEMLIVIIMVMVLTNFFFLRNNALYPNLDVMVMY